MSFWVAYSLCTSPCGQVHSFGLTFRLFSTVLVVIDSPLISHADFIMHLMSISFQYELENCCRFFLLSKFLLFIIWISGATFFFMRNSILPFIYVCIFHFSLLFRLLRCECETCVAGAKKYNNTFNFEANKRHAFTISIARHSWYWFLWIETTLRPFSPYFIPFSIEYNLNLQTLLFVSEHKLENGYGVYAILFLSLCQSSPFLFSLSSIQSGYCRLHNKTKSIWQMGTVFMMG